MINALSIGESINESASRGEFNRVQAEAVRRTLPYIADQQRSEIGLRDANSGLITIQGADLQAKLAASVAEIVSRANVNEANAAHLREAIKYIGPQAGSVINLNQAQATNINRQIEAIFRKTMADAGFTEAQIQSELARLPHIGPRAIAEAEQIRATTIESGARTRQLNVQSNEIEKFTDIRLREIGSRIGLTEMQTATLKAGLSSVSRQAAATADLTEQQAEDLRQKRSAIIRQIGAQAGLSEIQMRALEQELPFIKLIRQSELEERAARTALLRSEDVQLRALLTPKIQAATASGILDQARADQINRLSPLEAKKILADIGLIDANTQAQLDNIALNKVRADNIAAQTALTLKQKDDLVARMEFIRPLTEAEIEQRVSAGLLNRANARTENMTRKARLDAYVSENNLRGAQADRLRKEIERLGQTVEIEYEGVKYKLPLDSAGSTLNTIIRSKAAATTAQQTQTNRERTQNRQDIAQQNAMQLEADRERNLLVQKDAGVYKIPAEEIPSHAAIYNRNATRSPTLLVPTQRSGWIGSPYTGLVEVTIPKLKGQPQLTAADVTAYALSKGYNPETQMEQFLRDVFFPSMKLKYERYVKPVR